MQGTIVHIGTKWYFYFRDDDEDEWHYVDEIDDGWEEE